MPAVATATVFLLKPQLCSLGGWATRAALTGLVAGDDRVFRALNGEVFAKALPDSQGWELKNGQIEQHFRLHGLFFDESEGGPDDLEGLTFESAPIRLAFLGEGKKIPDDARDAEIVTCHGFAVDELTLVDLKDRSPIARLSGTNGWLIEGSGAYPQLYVLPDA